MMEKIAFKMKLKSGMREEYIRRHNEIWPELIQLLKDAGIEDYTIFLDEDTDTLFAVQRLQGSSSQDLGATDVVQRWWRYMSDLMEVNADHSPISTPLTQVFHLD